MVFFTKLCTWPIENPGTWACFSKTVHAYVASAVLLIKCITLGTVPDSDSISFGEIQRLFLAARFFSNLFTTSLPHLDHAQKKGKETKKGKFMSFYSVAGTDRKTCDSNWTCSSLVISKSILPGYFCQDYKHPRRQVHLLTNLRSQNCLQPHQPDGFVPLANSFSCTRSLFTKTVGGGWLFSWAVQQHFSCLCLQPVQIHMHKAWWELLVRLSASIPAAASLDAWGRGLWRQQRRVLSFSCPPLDPRYQWGARVPNVLREWKFKIKTPCSYVMSTRVHELHNLTRVFQITQ